MEGRINSLTILKKKEKIFRHVKLNFRLDMTKATYLLIVYVDRLVITLVLRGSTL